MPYEHQCPALKSKLLNKLDKYDVNQCFINVKDSNSYLNSVPIVM